MSNHAPRYWAFISYSHRDSRAASALQRAIETYRLPKSLVGTVTNVGEVPRAVKPVFRDRDELQVSTDLKAVVREALAGSRYLIVLCSPDAAASAWVNEEIAVFKKLHGDTRVLAVIARGEPFASRLPGREAEECFPAALRPTRLDDGSLRAGEHEPIAADLRPHGDGRRRATLKLVAGMVGLGADQLIRRDARRRMRQLSTIAAASVLGMTIMAGLALTAVQSRNEAFVQRREAEELLEFMLGDLRTKLAPVGRLDVLDAVGNKALAYYGRQAPDRLDADSLGRRSRALHLIGEMRQQRRQLDLAEAAFRRAAETTAQLLDRSPDHGQRIFDHAQSVYWVGHVAWLRGQFAAAEKAFHEYVALAERLVELDPANATWQRELGYAWVNVGVVCLDTARYDEALGWFARARAAWILLMQTDPERVMELATCLGWEARTHDLRGDLEQAIEMHRQKMRVLEGKPDAATNQLVKRERRVIFNELARLELTRGRAAAADDWARLGTESAEALVAVDPQNKIWREQLHLSQTLRAETRLALGDEAGARALARNARAETAGLLDANSRLASWQVGLRGRVLYIAAQVAQEDERPALIAELREYIQQAAAFDAGDRSTTTTSEFIAARAQHALALLLAREGRPAEARTEWSAAAARLQPFAPGRDWALLTLLATVRLHLGATAEARALAQRIETSTFRHPAFAELNQLLADSAGLSAAQSK